MPGSCGTGGGTGVMVGGTAVAVGVGEGVVVAVGLGVSVGVGAEGGTTIITSASSSIEMSTACEMGASPDDAVIRN